MLNLRIAAVQTKIQFVFKKPTQLLSLINWNVWVLFVGATLLFAHLLRRAIEKQVPRV